MKFSLITVSYNSAATIRDTIQSVIAQTHRDIEYIIVDGRSSDQTGEIVREFGSHIGTFVCEKDNGIYDAMNKGIRLAQGGVIAFINSDDFYASPDVISQINHVFESTDADCVFADLDYVERNDVARVIRKWRSQPFEAGAFGKGWHPAHPTFFARREMFDKYGGFDESLRISADYELMLRFLEVKRAKSVYLPAVLVKMRDGGESNRSVKNILKANIECYRSFARNGLKVSPFLMVRKPFSKLFQVFAAYRT